MLGAAAALMFVIGIVLAVAQPGNLGDDDANDTAASTSTTSSTLEGGDDTTTTTLFGADDTSSTTTAAPGVDEMTTTTFGGGSGGGSESTTTTMGSGLASNGSGSVGDGELSDTGGPAWLLPIGGALLVAGLTTRRLSQA